MKETVDSKKIIGNFVGRFITFGIVIGAIAFLIENLIPNLAKWELDTTRFVFQAVVFVISILLIIFCATKQTLKDVKFASKEEAKRVTKPIKTLLIICALCLMVCNLVYSYGIEKSAYKDLDKKYSQEIIQQSEIEALKYDQEKAKIHFASSLYLGMKEILTMFVFVYAAMYIEDSFVLNVEEKKTTKRTTKKATKKEDEE